MTNEPMSIFVIRFHATNRSMRMSEGLGERWKEERSKTGQQASSQAGSGQGGRREEPGLRVERPTHLSSETAVFFWI